MSTRDIVFIALFAAIVAALGAFPPLMLPLIGVPITAQSLGVMLAGSVLGARRGSLAIILFLVLVAVGVPVLAGGRGGIGVFFGPRGGFLLGWPIGAFVIGWLVERAWTRLDVWRAFAINLIGGVAVIYACGVPWIAIVAETSLTQAAVGSMGFLPGGVIKAAIAAFVAVTVKRSYPIIARVEAGAGGA